MESDTNDIDGSSAGSHDYRQLGVLREFGNIANSVSDDEFKHLMCRTPKLNRVKWQKILTCLRERIQQDVSEHWSNMWTEENMTEKLEILEKQKEKFSDVSRPQPMWRPQIADVKAQLKSTDAAILTTKRQVLELEANEYESRVAIIKKTLIQKRAYLRSIQSEMQKCQKKNENTCNVVDKLLDKHSEVAEEIYPLRKEYEEY